MAYNTSTSTQSNSNNRAERVIRYIDKDFDNFKNSLIEYSKTYFPDTYTDFSPSSPGMMFIEMAAYVGDVLSFYQDNQIQETFTQFASQTSNIYQLAYMMGYKPKVTGAAVADLDVFQVIGASSGAPDWSDCVIIPSNTRVTSTVEGKSGFITQNFIDFSVSSSANPTEISVYQTTGATPTKFLLKKTTQALSAQTASAIFSFGSYEKYPTVIINDSNIIKIIECTGGGDTWSEVPYLGQDTVLIDEANSSNDGDFSVPYILKLKRTNKRFATRFLSKDKLQIQFGPGGEGSNDENIVPNPSNVGAGNANENFRTAFSPSNFTFTNTYGTAPVNTTLTFTYLKGGGISSNAPANTLTQIDRSGITGGDADARASVICNNPEPATGGSSGDSADEIRENSLRMFGTQLRSVTTDDYTVRALSMPGTYGAVGKIYVEPERLENINPNTRPSVLDMYVLGYDNNKRLTTTSATFKKNLSTYLSQFRMANDTVTIKDGFIVNIGIDFSLVLRPNYAGNKVLETCLNTLKSYFNIDKWQISQPIFITDLYTVLDKVEGVQTVKSIVINNKSGGNYSPYFYDVKGATMNNVVFPSQDPSIFEVKFPNSDIKGSITNF